MSESGGSKLAARFAGQGLADTLRREQALNRKRKKQSKQQACNVPVVSGEEDGPAGPEGMEQLLPADPGPPRRSVRDDPIDGVAANQRKSLKDTPESPRDMAARLYRAFAGQMDQLEARLAELFENGGAGPPPGGLPEIDRTVKTLASLAKTLSALMDLKSTAEPVGEGVHLDDREELRAALARRLERLCQAGAD